jgi:hypothetical protein
MGGFVMPSPFPGMNPYLEREGVWSDFHNRLIVAAAEAIGSQVRPAYIVKIDQNVFVEEPGENGRDLVGRPDLFVTETGSELRTAAGGVAVAEPTKAVIVPAIAPERDPFIEIRDLDSRKLITAIELLSPSNKEHPATRAQYLAKRTTYLKSDAHFVEMDLLRGGPRMPLAPRPAKDYCVVVSRAQDRPEVDVWSIGLRDPLPVIPIPLRPGDGDAHLDLQAVVNRVYDVAGYEHYVYGSEPEPGLKGEDRKWAEEVLKASESKSAFS